MKSQVSAFGHLQNIAAASSSGLPVAVSLLGESSLAERPHCLRRPHAAAVILALFIGPAWLQGSGLRGEEHTPILEQLPDVCSLTHDRDGQRRST